MGDPKTRNDGMAERRKITPILKDGTAENYGKP